MLKQNILKFYCIFFAVFLHFNSFTQCQSGDCEDGYGLYTMTWGDRYQGGWKNGLMHGQELINLLMEINTLVHLKVA